MATVTDLEVEFLRSVVEGGATLSINDLRKRYFELAINGDLPAPDSEPVAVPEGINASGTPSSTTYLRGDGSWATPPDTNTTYSAMPSAEAKAGTATTQRTVSASVLRDAVESMRFPAPPAEGTAVLTSTNGVLSWEVQA